MILLGLGANLPGRAGAPADTLDFAVACMRAAGITVARRSSWVASTPWGVLGQPAFVNGVVAIEAHVPPEALLTRCQRIERLAGRRRGRRWGARVLDIDILDWHGVIRRGCSRLILPHPEIAARAFVLEPLREIAPRWHHPLNGLTPVQMLNRVRAREGRVSGPAGSAVG